MGGNGPGTSFQSKTGSFLCGYLGSLPPIIGGNSDSDLEDSSLSCCPTCNRCALQTDIFMLLATELRGLFVIVADPNPL